MGVVALQAIKRFTRNKFRLWRDVNCCEQLELRETIGNLSNLISCRSEGFVHAACRNQEVLTCSHSVSWSPCDILQKLSFQELQRSASRSCSFHGNNNTWNNALPECGNYPTVQNITLELTQLVCGSDWISTDKDRSKDDNQNLTTETNVVIGCGHSQLPASSPSSCRPRDQDVSVLVKLDIVGKWTFIPPYSTKDLNIILWYLMSARFWPIPISCLI